jgi:hypothetical protein
MKNILYLYLLLISSSVTAMQPVNKKQIPMNDKQNSPLSCGIIPLVASKVMLTPPPLACGLAPLASFCVANPFPMGTLIIGTGIGIGAYALVNHCMNNKNNNNKDK